MTSIPLDTMEEIAYLRTCAAKEGRLLPPLPDCSAPWCSSCNYYRKWWADKGIIIKR